MAQMTLKGVSVFSSISIRTFIALLISFIFSSRKSFLEGIHLGIIFCLSLFLLYHPFLKNSAQAMSLFFTFPLFLLLFNKKVPWTLLSILLQTFLGFLLLNKKSFTFIVFEDVVRCLLASFLFSYFLHLASRVNNINRVLRNFFLLLFCFSTTISIFYNESLSNILSIGWKNSGFYLFFGISLYWCFLTVFQATKIVGKTQVGLFCFYMPLVHSIYSMTMVEHLGLSKMALIGMLALFFGPILYLVSDLSWKKRDNASSNA